MFFMQKQQHDDSRIFSEGREPLKEGESGATVVEYAVILTLIAAAIIFAVSLVGKDTRNAYEKVNTVLVENTSTVVEDDPDDKCKGKDSDDDEDCGIGND